jgi:hypothetical protein
MLNRVLAAASAATILVIIGTPALANGRNKPAVVYKDAERHWKGDGSRVYRTDKRVIDYDVPCALPPYYPRSYHTVAVAPAYAVGDAPVYNRPPCICD